MDAEIKPRADELEREAILTAVERAGACSGHRSAWREAGLGEATAAGEDSGMPQPAARPRSTPGATRA